MVTYQEVEQDKIINDLRAGEEESLTQTIASEAGVPYKDLTDVTINTDALRLVPMKTACGADSMDELMRMAKREKLSTDEQQVLNGKIQASAEMAAFAMVGKQLDVAVKSPTNDQTIREINRLEGLGYETTIYMVSGRSLNKAWSRYADISAAEVTRGGLLDIADENLQSIAAAVSSNTDIKNRLEEIFNSGDSHQVSRVLETVFGSAIAMGSSDVHFEPEEKFARLRFREDGVLQEIVQIDPVLYQKLLNRMKFISGMKLTITETAQDGRFTIFYKGQEMEVRVAVAPGAYNESIVMRILNPEGLAVDFGTLGIEPKLLKILEREIIKPNGMILTTGPTGSGKTTTLYSFLKKVYSSEKKIITIEDPIEYHLPGITQEQVSHEKGFDFLAGLRAALRQDPEIIMVGEIRDKETATIAVNASLTGHMVFSTLHTNNAAGTIPRLLDLGIQPGILSNALTVAIAQRLVRKLCTECKKKAVITQDQEATLRAVIRHAESIGKDFSDYHISSDMDFSLYEPVGCDACNQTGFKGRVGLYEVILMDDVMAAVTVQEPSPNERDIKRAAEHQKLFTLPEDGVVKILSGITSFDEIQGVVDLTEDISEGEEVQNKPQDTNTKPQTLRPTLQSKVDYHPKGESAVPLYQSETTGEEIALLIDYLKILEDHQQKNPNVGVADKIAKAQGIILSILKNTPNLEQLFSPINPGMLVRDQIDQLIHELSALQADQEKNPNVGVAQEIAKIRNTIQTMHREVA